MLKLYPLQCNSLDFVYALLFQAAQERRDGDRYQRLFIPLYINCTLASCKLRVMLLAELCKITLGISRYYFEISTTLTTDQNIRTVALHPFLSPGPQRFAKSCVYYMHLSVCQQEQDL